MSGVPQSRREQHDFQATTNLRNIRREITELAIHDFGYDKARLETQLKNFEERVSKLDTDRKAEIIASYREKNESFYADFAEEETKVTRDLLRQAVCEFEIGNSIFPAGQTKILEYCERRKRMDIAIGYLKALKQELMYIAETLPGDKNRYEKLNDRIDEEISLIKGVRQSANRFLKEGDADADRKPKGSRKKKGQKTEGRAQ